MLPFGPSLKNSHRNFSSSALVGYFGRFITVE